MREIEGVYVANVTPFVDDGSLAVDEDAYLEHVSWLAEMGVRGIVPLGTNGEGPSLTLGEKLRVPDPDNPRRHAEQPARDPGDAARPGGLSCYRRARPATLLLQAGRARRDGALLRVRALRDRPHSHRLPYPQVRRPRSPPDRERAPRLGRQRLWWGGRLRRSPPRKRQGRAPRYGG